MLVGFKRRCDGCEAEEIQPADLMTRHHQIPAKWRTFAYVYDGGSSSIPVELCQKCLSKLGRLFPALHKKRLDVEKRWLPNQKG